MPSGSELLQILINAVLLSGVLSLVALGFALVWGIMNIVNLAHGAFIMLGAYFTFGLHAYWGMDPFLTLPLVMAVLYVLGLGVQHALVNRVIRAPLLSTFLLTFGLEILIVNLVNYFFKADTRSVITAYSGAGWTVGSVRVPYVRLAALGIALVLAVSLWWFLTHTRNGRAIRATGMDIDAARLTGVRVSRIYAMTFGVGAAIAGAAGALLSLMVPFDPNIGAGYTQRAFVICVLGGLGNVLNVVIGALVYAVVEVFVGARMPELAHAVPFVMLVLLLMLRPRGIAGKSFYA